MLETIVFYEVADITQDRLPSLSDTEKDFFDAVNNIGAATRTALYTYGKVQGYNLGETAQALSNLVTKGCLKRRTLVDRIR